MSEPRGDAEVGIPEEIGPILANALPSWNAVAMAHVDADGKPRISFRGSVQRFNSKQLGLWARTPTSSVLGVLDTNPTLAFIFADWFEGDPEKRVYLNFVGRGHIETDEDVRRVIYDNLPQIEKDHDPEGKGVAILVDVDEISGWFQGGPFRLQLT